MKKDFIKTESAGNDFILFDHTEGESLPNLEKNIIKLCTRKLGIGADGVLIIENIEKESSADFRMRIFNPDGGEAEMCGNGARCAAYWFFLKTGKSKLKFQTLGGMISASVSSSGRVRLGMPSPQGTELDILLNLGKDQLSMSFINTGVPHAVIETDRLEQVDVDSLGRKIRNHPHFSPAGTNVDFVQVTGKNSVSVRTYERGVEEETLACGTGSVASVLIKALKGKVSSPVTVKTRGGALLKVYFKLSDAEDLISRLYDVKLEGKVNIVFSGSIDL
ncbi:MAG: diaminopimelate epimerase [Elusimicrobia bacterium]|nr:diaminopimelate epimerase [Elusimicrobiota bacterium]